MNEQQRWELIEMLFEKIAKQCDEIMRLLGEPAGTLHDVGPWRVVDTGLETGIWADGTVRFAGKCPPGFYSFVSGPHSHADDMQQLLNAPISTDEAKHMLEAAKEYLREGR